MIAYANLLVGGDPADFDLAKSLLETAIAGGGDNTISGYATLGDLYAVADPAHADAAKAIDAYRQAAAGGDVGAMIKLARILGEGNNASNFDEAVALIDRALAAGNGTQGWAWSTLGDLYRTAGPERHDPAKAADAYRHAMDAGDTGAMVRLATMLASGDGMPVDFGAATALLQRAIAKNDGNGGWAWSTLGDIYRNADDAHASAELAVDAYRHAADLGDTGGMIKLGTMVASGNGTDRDLAAGVAFLEKAAAVGDGNKAWAFRALGDLYRYAPPRFVDLTTALKYYAQAAAAGDADSSLSAALIESDARVAGRAQLTSMVDHYRGAAEGLGTTPVAKAMYNLSPPSLYFTVQAFLSQLLATPIAVDGVYGARTTEAVKSFCASSNIECDGTIITFPFLEALLTTEPPPLEN